MKHLSLGIPIAIGALLLALFSVGGRPILYFHPPELIAVLIAPLGLMISSFGPRRLWGAAQCSMGLKRANEEDCFVLEKWIKASYVVSFLTFLGGAVFILNLIDQGPVVAAFRFAAALCAPIYALLICEIVLRPALTRGQQV
ncbi:hypothetical protein [Pelagicoccus sp. SDUM812003]|uniref:hypothetical protein n=1 Tax=Pelagicoccus sp. SDUM812003 TaxID=3041267 RepID=UPI00280C50B8|nr:hypothetical protein [Pelagicoccus sp. SDUM812003]MDQ8203850.1 hypothetical protein [Pelagicoccus sp. SDUM812003]